MSKSDAEIVTDMIKFVENREREIQAAKLGRKTKTTAIKDIMKELDEETKK